MRQILRISGYEYKKILKRKGTWIAFAALLGMILVTGFGTLLGDIYVDGERVCSQYEEMRGIRAAVLEKEGAVIDGDLLEKAQKAYQPTTDPEFWKSPAKGWEKYEKTMYPWTAALDLTDGINQDLAALETDKFYQLREEKMRSSYEEMGLSEEEVSKHMEENSRLDTPFPYRYTGAYGRFFAANFSTGMFLAFGVAFCLAPLFSGERTTKMDQLVLTARYGKNKLITAKLFTGFSFAVLVSLLGFGIQFLEIGLFYGFEGGGAPVQADIRGILLSIPINMAQMTGIVIGVSTMAICMTAGFTIICSVKMKSTTAVITLSAILIFIPFTPISALGSSVSKLADILVSSLPSNMMYTYNAFQDRLLPVAGGQFYFFQVIPVVYLVLLVLMTTWGYRSFRRYQVR